MALTDLNFLKVEAEWPPPSEKPRLDQYEENEQLFEGDHEKVFKSMWTRAMKWEDGTSLEFILDWPKRLSTLWADLVAGDPPAYKVGEGNDALQEQLDDVIERNDFNILLYDIQIDRSRFGDGLFKLRTEDGLAVIEGQSPRNWYPVSSIGNVNHIKAHVLVWKFKGRARGVNAGSLHDKDIDMLKIEIHRKGSIEHRVVGLGKAGRISHIEDVMAHFGDELPQLQGVEANAEGGVEEQTGIDDFLIQPAPGLKPIGRAFGLDDYKPIEGLVQEMEARLAQISKILDKHADPGMYGPASALVYDRRTGEATFIGGGKYYPLEEGETPPGYIVWDAALTSAFEQFDKLLENFYLLSETSAAAFGSADLGVATSGTALRRLMLAPLAKARKLGKRLDPAVRRTLKIAIQLENQAMGDVGQKPEEEEDGDEAA